MRERGKGGAEKSKHFVENSIPFFNLRWVTLPDVLDVNTGRGRES